MTDERKLNDYLPDLQKSGNELLGDIEPETHAGAHGSVRTFEHDGHQVTIETHYRITIDGEIFPDPLHVASDGSVHYHGLPQYSAPSAVDIVKAIVERLEARDIPQMIGDDEAEYQAKEA